MASKPLLSGVVTMRSKDGVIFLDTSEEVKDDPLRGGSLVPPTPGVMHGSEVLHRSMLLRGGRSGIPKAPKSGSWTIRLTRVASLTTSAGGLMQLITLVYPTQMSRGTNLVTAFRMARLLSTKIQYASLQGSNPTTPFSWLSGFDEGATTGTSAFQPDMLENSKLFPSTLVTRVTNSWKCRNSPWSYSDVSATGTDPLGGICGGWIHYALTTTPNSTAVLSYEIECWYEFKELR